MNVRTSSATVYMFCVTTRCTDASKHPSIALIAQVHFSQPCDLNSLMEISCVEDAGIRIRPLGKFGLHVLAQSVPLYHNLRVRKPSMTHSPLCCRSRHSCSANHPVILLIPEDVVLLKEL